MYYNYILVMLFRKSHFIYVQAIQPALQHNICLLDYATRHWQADQSVSSNIYN